MYTVDTVDFRTKKTVYHKDCIFKINLDQLCTWCDSSAIDEGKATSYCACYFKCRYLVITFFPILSPEISSN